MHHVRPFGRAFQVWPLRPSKEWLIAGQLSRATFRRSFRYGSNSDQFQRPPLALSFQNTAAAVVPKDLT